MIRVLVAEDMRILRDTLVSVLNLEDDIKVVAQVAAGTDIVPAALAERPDLAVLEIDLPGLDGISAAARLHDPKLALAALEMKESPLSERETDVLRRFAAGVDLPAIAAELFLSYGTVRNYMASAVTKLGGRNRMDAVRIATDAGWL